MLLHHLIVIFAVIRLGVRVVVALAARSLPGADWFQLESLGYTPIAPGNRAITGVTSPLRSLTGVTSVTA